jgi:hypothetical protein
MTKWLIGHLALDQFNASRGDVRGGTGGVKWERGRKGDPAIWSLSRSSHARLSYQDEKP